MRRRLVAGALLAISISAFAINFAIDHTWSSANPQNQFLATTAVNTNSATRAYVALPTTKVNEVHMMTYTNPWSQPYKIVNKLSSVPWEPAGPAIDLSCIFPGCSPIVLDLKKNGVLLGDHGVIVLFDINANGSDNQIQWVRPNGDEAFLVLDRNGNREIDSGAELFGNYTAIPGVDELPPHGFAALAHYDDPKHGGNDDGLISDADAVWTRLELWLDLNADGETGDGELGSLSDHGIVSLGLDSVENKILDHAGNWLRYWGTAACSDLAKPDACDMDMVDVFFVI